MPKTDAPERADEGFCIFIEKLRNPFIRRHFQSHVRVEENEYGKSYFIRFTARANGVSPSGRA